jgi:hypothetical protein
MPEIFKSFVKSLRDRILHEGRTSASKDEKDFAFGDEAKTLSKKIDEKITNYKYTAPKFETADIELKGGKRRRAAKKSSGKKRGGAKKKSSKKRSSGKRRGGAAEQDGGKKKMKKSSGKRRGGAKKKSSKKRSSGRKH